MEEIQEMLTASTFRPSVYVPDEEDLELLKKHIISKILQTSSNWLKFSHKAPDDVVRMVLAGEIPTNTSGVQTGLFTATATCYSGGLVHLLGLIQEELINAGAAQS